MAARSPASLKSAILLGALCLAVAIAGWLWSAWDMFGPAHRSMLQGWDDSFYYYWLPSVVIDHDVDFSNQIAQSETMNADMRAIATTFLRTPTGLPDNKYPPGWALGSLPFFLLAHVLAPSGSTGFEPVYLVAVTLGQLLYAAAGLWLAIKLLERNFSRPVAALAVFVGWLASPLIYYQSARLTMTHSQVFTLALAVFWISLRIADGDQRARAWTLLGFTAALLLATRNVAVVYLALPGWILFRHLRSFPHVGWLLAGAAIPAAAQLLAWKFLYGSWIAYSYGGERFDFSHLHLREVLFSARHGWFYWHPLLLVGVLVFFTWAWRRPEGRAWLLSFGAIVVLSAAWPTWWLGSSFGYRGFEVPVFFAMIGLAVIFEAATARKALALRRLCLSLGTTAVLWNALLLILFLAHRIPREEAVTYADAARSLLQWCNGGR